MEAVLPMRRRSHGSIRSPTVKRDSQSVVVIKGWLHKLEGVGIKQWKQRWCVLSDFCLFFYKGPNEDKVFSTVLLPSYKINPCDNDDRISRKFAFKAEHHNMKTYYFAAENKDCMKNWMNAMSLASIMQNFVAKSEVVESGLGSTSNDEEDSGFTSYRSRRYDQDPNSTFDSSQGSDRLKQRSHSCGERVGEMYLSSDDKYPTTSRRGQQHPYKSHSAHRSGRPRQPLYANAPPKPKRMTHSDPFAISPGEQYGEMGYSVGQNFIEYQDSPEGYGYPDVVYPTQGMENMDPFMVNQHDSSYLENEMFQNEHVSYSNLHPKGYDGHRGSTNSFEHVPRPHSADFLEREAESFIPVQNQRQEPQRQRPKSSMEYYGKYWDVNNYTAEDYREAVRLQADSLFTNRKQTTHQRHHHPQHVDDQKVNSDMPLTHKDSYMPSHCSQPVLTSNRYPQYSPNVSHQKDVHDGTQYSSNPHSSSTHKSKPTHEESMKRLLEWKQRMLQSPLTKRSVQYSSSSSETGSPRRPPNRPPLPNEYREKVIHELERHEAFIQEPFCHDDKRYHNSSSTSSLKDHIHYVNESVIIQSETRTSSEEGNRHCNSSINDLSHSTKYDTGHGNSERNRDTRAGAAKDNNIMYCVDSENNEILIYEDKFVAEVPANERESRAVQKSSEEYNRRSDRKKVSQSSSASDLGSNLLHCSSGSGSVFYSPVQNPPVQAPTLRRAATQKLNVGYSSDDEASIDVESRNRHGGSRNKMLLSRKNASDPEINVQKPCHLQKLVHVSETIMNKGKRLSMSAGDLLGKTHEELVLLLIQLRRNQSRVIKAKEKCLHQLGNIKHGSQKDGSDNTSYASNYNEIIQLLDRQFESTKPLINLVDNMVKLGSLYGGEEKRIPSALHLSAPDLNKCQEKNLPVDLHAWSSMEDSDLQEHITELYGLDQETHSYSSLQQDREMLETTLHGMRSKILDHQDKPFELQKLRKQQRLIEKELTRVKRLLCQSAKKIEDATTKNDQLEQEILLLRQKLQQALKTGSNEMKSSQSRADLEAELTRVQNVLEELANHRQEINNTVETSKNEALARVSCASKVRASPTGVAGSAPLPLRKKQQSTYLETDLDTMITLDLSNVCKEADDIPLYANAEEISQKTFASENAAFPESGLLVSSTGSDKENISQCSLQDINEADDKMKQFYGILPREKPCEIKTVRIVKRQSERRNRERDKKRVTYGDQSSVWVLEEPDMSSDDQLETDDEVFKKSSARPTSILLPGFTPNKTSSGLKSAHERLFGNNASARAPETAPVKSSKSGRRHKRRHYTVTGCQNVDDPMFEFSKERPRSRDDVDMERCLRTANTPDIVRSTIKKKEVFDDEIIDRELGLPQKISIPERYIEDEPEYLSASERLRRSLKAENIRKMLSETTANYENVAKCSDAPAETVHKKFTEQKRNRAHLLALNHALAQEVMERSKAVAVFATLRRKKRLAPIEDLSPMVDLPITQQRYNLLC